MISSSGPAAPACGHRRAVSYRPDPNCLAARPMRQNAPARPAGGSLSRPRRRTRRGRSGQAPRTARAWPIRRPRPPLNQRLRWSGTTGRRAAVTVGAQITGICAHTGGTLTRQSAAPNGGYFAPSSSVPCVLCGTARPILPCPHRLSAASAAGAPPGLLAVYHQRHRGVSQAGWQIMGQLQVPLLDVVKTALEAAMVRHRRQLLRGSDCQRPICKARYM